MKRIAYFVAPERGMDDTFGPILGPFPGYVQLIYGDLQNEGEPFAGYGDDGYYHVNGDDEPYSDLVIFSDLIDMQMDSINVQIAAVDGWGISSEPDDHYPHIARVGERFVSDKLAEQHVRLIATGFYGGDQELPSVARQALTICSESFNEFLVGTDPEVVDLPLNFVRSAFTENTGGNVMADVLVMNDGTVIAITGDVIARYPSLDAWNNGGDLAGQLLRYETPHGLVEKVADLIEGSAEGLLNDEGADQDTCRSLAEDILLVLNFITD